MAERAAECVRGRAVENAFLAAVARFRSLADCRWVVKGEELGL